MAESDIILWEFVTAAPLLIVNWSIIGIKILISAALKFEKKTHQSLVGIYYFKTP